MRPTRIRRAFSGLAVVVWGVWVTIVIGAEPAADEPRKPKVPMLKIEQFSLPNGLRVVLHEDHKTPVVGVNLWYRVGSKDEKPGRTGFAHLFEHMMFQGSKHHDSDYFIPLEKLGADLNGTTGEDDTIYYETVPSNALELALWLEADRMGFLLPSMTQQRLDNQRDVVKNERRETVDNCALRSGRGSPAESPLSGRSSLSPQRDRVDGRPVCRSPGGRLGIFPHLLRPEQCNPVRRRRFSTRAGQELDQEVLRPASARARYRPAQTEHSQAGGIQAYHDRPTRSASLAPS